MVGKVVTREWRRAERAKLEFAFVLAFIDIIKVLDSISWVRCASNNVFRQNIGMFKRLCTQTYDKIGTSDTQNKNLKTHKKVLNLTSPTPPVIKRLVRSEVNSVKTQVILSIGSDND